MAKFRYFYIVGDMETRNGKEFPQAKRTIKVTITTELTVASNYFNTKLVRPIRSIRILKFIHLTL